MTASRLPVETAGKEHGIGDAPLPTSAYVHVPFCLHRCGYCDFTVVAGRDDLMDAYLACLETELRWQLVNPQTMKTLFIGGGTPSYLPAPQLQRLLELLNHWLPLEHDGEFSIECNPERFTQDRMDVLAAGGINRVSLGVQSFDASHLQTLERTHTADTVASVLEQLRSRGLNNISLDLIFGVPGQSLSNWEQSLQRAVDLNPRHISTYGLTYEKGTAFWTRRAKQTLIPIAEETEREMYARSIDWLPQHGFRQYELSNFALPGSECRHNRVYWRGEPYYGIGPGAAGYHREIRSLNHRSVTTWIRRVQNQESPVQERESLDHDLQRREAVMLGLRQVEGISKQQYYDRFQNAIEDLEPEAYQHFIASGWLEETATHVRLTREGRFVADTVMSEFL